MQEAIKNLLIFIKEIGFANHIYTAFHLLSFVVAVPCFLLLGRKMNIEYKKSFFSLLLICIGFLAVMYFIGWLEAVMGLGNFGRKNAVTIYVWVPLICIGVAKIVKLDNTTLLSMMAFAMPLIQAVSRPGCIVAGCCRGFAWEYGVYQPWVKEYLFPMPLFEMMWMFGIAFFVLWLIKRNEYKATKWMYPLMMAVFGAVQFFSEFFINNEKIWNGLSLRNFHELSMIAVGVFWLYDIYEKWEKERARKNRFKKPKSRKED